MSNSSTENLQRAGCFLVSEANKTRSRTQGVLAVDNNLEAGTVLGKVSTGAGTSAVKASGANTGNGAMGAITVGAGALPGKYTLRITAAASNAGAFVVKDPQGDVVGEGNVAAAFSGGGISFTLADGGTDFIVGDGFDITVARGTGVYSALNVAGTAGEAVAAGILFAGVDTTDIDDGLPCVVVDDDAEVHPAKLVWPVGITVADKATAVQQLRDLGIKMSPTY